VTVTRAVSFCTPSTCLTITKYVPAVDGAM
jgi:hypothetical protein